ncbi:MAG TPA: PQQ-binding-like beta-propeller repeat protein [Gemmataceae bacterium]|nr:PQQ-binding-like beta-propeller repeat protein [Gemmataceae bacterium]
MFSQRTAVIILALFLVPISRAFSAEGALPATFARQVQPAVDQAGEPLPKGAIARLGTTRLMHDGDATAVAFSPDGKILAASCSGKIIFWDSASGKRIRHLPIGSAGYLTRHCLDFSPDGKLLAVAHRDIGVAGPPRDQYTGQVTYWDVATGKHVRSFKMPTKFSPDSPRFSPDGKSLAISNNQEILMAEAGDGGQRWKQRIEKSMIYDFVFSPDGKTLAVSTSSGNVPIQLLDVGTGQVLRTLEQPVDLSVGPLAFSRDGKSLATVTSNGVFVWEVATGKVRTQIAAKMRMGCGAAFGPDNKTLIAATFDTEVFIWDLEKKEVRSRHGRLLSVAGTRAVLSPDGKMLAVAASYSKIHIWDVAAGKEMFTDIVGHDSWVRSLAFSPDGGMLASGGDLWETRLWDTKTWKPVRSLDTNANMLSFSPDGKQLVVLPFVATNFPTHSSGTPNKPMSIWDVGTGKEIATFPDQGGKVRWGTLVPGGKRLVSLDDIKLAAWDIASRKQVSEYMLPTAAKGGRTTVNLIGNPLLTHDGKIALLAITQGDGGRKTKTDMLAIDLESGKGRLFIPGNVSTPLALSPDGKFYVFGPSKIGLRDLEKGNLIDGLDPDFGKDPTWHSSIVAFSSNGRLLASAPGYSKASGGGDREAPRVRLWDVKTGKEIASFTGDHSFIASLAFSPDGNQLLSGMCNGSILV